MFDGERGLTWDVFDIFFTISNWCQKGCGSSLARIPTVRLAIKAKSSCRKIESLPGQSKLANLVVVLVRPRNPLNIGAAARAMSNFGAHRLRLVNAYAPGFREARSAVGASELLNQAEEYKTVAEAVADCALVVGTTAVRNRVLQQPVHLLNEESGKTIRRQLQGARVAV